ncbi:Uncharacterized protein dnm_035750 [Desulfonema magnum]|uniref:Uncharacterized protein n=1 Tax=Desulfonema magnum TaxID=45655 RepID=A0A975BL73_9BACT|nr:Uncharacterized protein dnm_035750 [Desulfonema magnum]
MPKIIISKYPAKSFPIFYRRCPMTIQNLILENIWPGTYEMTDEKSNFFSEFFG